MSLLLALSANAATNNSGNAPAFITIDICSNGIGDGDGNFDAPRMEPEVFDIGLDFGADGSVDRWLSNESATYMGRGNSDVIQPGSWIRLYFFQLDEFTGQNVQVHLVDRSQDYYMAINSIRVSGADGKVISNPLKNGFFEDGLTGWNVVESSIQNHDTLIHKDNDATFVNYSGSFLSTMSNPDSGDFSETAVLVSGPFQLAPVTSFIYGMVSGGGSEFVNLPGALGSDNKSGVYIDLGSETEDPNGQYDEGVDIPLVGFWGGAAGGGRNDFASVFFNTSGKEGLRAQVVGFDDSLEYHIALDAFRMNWDWEESIIVNGGFDQGIPTPESDPSAFDWFDEVGDFLMPSDHPSGSVPGWQIKGDTFFFDANARKDHMSGRTFLGTGGFDLFNTGAEIRSDVFVIQNIPDAATNVFVQFASAQGTDRIRYSSEGAVAFARVELIVDVDGNGEFGDAADFRYLQRNQGMAPNQSNSGRDLWHHPEYRWYIKEEHQGMSAIFRAEDNFGPFKASWGWMCIDDLFVWNGQSAELAFPNSDFEQGTLDNWNAQISGGTGFESWLSGSKKSIEAGLVTHSVMNNRVVEIDGDFAADTAARETGGGDSGLGVLSSIPFSLPSLAQGGGAASIKLTDNNQEVVLEWESGTLHSAESVSGPYNEVTGATSPHQISPKITEKFFIVR